MTTILFNKEGNAIIPQNANPADSGYDLVAMDAPKIVGNEEYEHSGLWRRIDYIEYRTGIKVQPLSQFNREEGRDDKFFTLIYPRSSISKYNLILANSVGVIDNTYRGELLLRFKYVYQPEDLHYEIRGTTFINSWVQINQSKIYKKGDKIGQLVCAKLIPMNFVEATELQETERNQGGFGSTGN